MAALQLLLRILCGLSVIVVGVGGAAMPSRSTLAAALLDDMLPSSSAACTPDGGYSSLEYPTGANHSTSWWEPYRDLEPSLFAGVVGHHDANSNRSWELRVGRGGNVYSFRGAYGEAMPPQYHTNAPWIDEVWQMVAVDQTQNDPSNGRRYFIHQAGAYTREPGLVEQPFFSPTLASHCSTNGSCAFAAWGQHAHVPTNFTSRMIYYTRFRDCGNGVLETMYMMHHFGVSGEQGGDTWEYFNMPWGGVRPSVFKSFTLASKDDGTPGAESGGGGGGGGGVRV